MNYDIDIIGNVRMEKLLNILTFPNYHRRFLNRRNYLPRNNILIK